MSAHFTITDYTNSVVVEPSGEVRIDVTVENDGDEAGDVTVRLRDHNNNVVASDTLSGVEPGGTASTTLIATAPAEYGDYIWKLEAYNNSTGNVDDSKNVYISVTEPSPTPTPTPTATPTPTPTATPTPTPTPTPSPTPTPTPTPTATPTATPTPTPTPVPAFRIVDVSAPSSVPAGSVFTITVTVINDGSAEGDLRVVVIDESNVIQGETDHGTVLPGEQVDVGVTLTAPSTPDTYTWTVEAIEDPSGEVHDTYQFMFDVVAPSPTPSPTPTSTPTPTPTPTPVWKQWWFWAAVVLFAIIMLLLLGGGRGKR